MRCDLCYPYSKENWYRIARIITDKYVLFRSQLSSSSDRKQRKYFWTTDEKGEHNQQLADAPRFHWPQHNFGKPFLVHCLT